MIISSFHFTWFRQGKFLVNVFCTKFSANAGDNNEQVIRILMKLCWQSSDLHKIEPCFIPHEIWRHIFIWIIKLHWSGRLITRRGWLFIVLCSFFTKYVSLTTWHQKLEIISWKLKQKISKLAEIQMFIGKWLSCWRVFRTMSNI